jgi:phosphoribosylformylglycinamidine cyclo-ligase
MTFLTYKDSGVDIKKADNVLNRIKGKIHATYNTCVMNSIGGFASLTEVPREYNDPVMVSSTDGVGTKLKIAFVAGEHSTVGIDLVAMCANDILTLGAKPFFFLDYFACGRLEDKVYSDVIAGICDGCALAGCALVGGETAEMPSFYKDGEYDLAGFGIGFVERSKIVDGSSIEPGDAIIALPSSGLHSNGYSLVRKALFEVHNIDTSVTYEGFSAPLWEELLKPTKIYARAVLPVLRKFSVKGMAHITGGGLPGNIERILPEGSAAELSIDGHHIKPIFRFIQKLGNVADEEMLRTFNMGLGFVVVVGKKERDAILDELFEAGEEPFVAGQITDATGDMRVSVTIRPGS